MGDYVFAIANLPVLFCLQQLVFVLFARAMHVDCAI